MLQTKRQRNFLYHN